VQQVVVFCRWEGSCARTSHEAARPCGVNVRLPTRYSSSFSIPQSDGFPTCLGITSKDSRFCEFAH
jgi:hypothetical protein